MPRRILAVAALIFSMLGSFADADESPLPARHQRALDIDAFEYAAYGLLYRTDSRWVKYRAGFDNVDHNRLSIRWQAGTFDGEGYAMFRESAVEHTREHTQYRPLAVAVEAGLSNALLVVGWSTAKEETVVERWTFSNGDFFEERLPDGTSHIEYHTPEITKAELYRGTDAGLAYDAVFHPVTRHLLILADCDTSNRPLIALYELDVDADTPQLIEREDIDFPLLQSRVGMKLAVPHGCNATYIFMFSIADWVHVGSFFRSMTHVLCDSDGDGTFDISYAGDSSAISRMHEHIDWNKNYRSTR